jgi:hypothetical protein
MTKLIYIMPIAMLALAGCNNATCVFDSEISAINRQSEVLREQNRILERIAATLDKIEKNERRAK